MTAWLTTAVPKGRIAAFRTLVYLFVVADLVILTPWVRTHRDAPPDLYQPVRLARLLRLPTPTPALVDLLFWTLLIAATLAASGRLPRLLGWTVFAAYAEWMIIAMSYGKVDHDRFALLVALAALPTAGPARHGDASRTERGGWALRITQIAAVSTYFLAAWAKLRFGGLEWMTGSVLARAFARRGTGVTDLITAVPGALVAAQIIILTFELLSPVVFALRGRWRYAVVAAFYLFHWLSMATVTISFAPQQVALGSFLPLEKVRPLVALRNRRRRLEYRTMPT